MVTVSIKLFILLTAQLVDILFTNIAIKGCNSNWISLTQ